jgi:hypothetical protein
MAYQQGGKIEASDYNTLATSINDTLDDIGQTKLPVNLAAGGTVLASDWSNLVTKVANVANHQGSGITSISDPNTSTKVSFRSELNTNITNIRSGRKNAAAQGTDATTTTVNASRWYDKSTFTHKIAFASATAAQYFFNGGGQIRLSFSHPTGSAIDTLFNTLATACGTIVLSSPSSGTVSIASATYNGITKVGGSGTTTALLTNAGYYGLTSTNQEVFKQFGTSLSGFGGVNYNQSYISINMNVGDAGATINITTLWDEYPNGLTTTVLAGPPIVGTTTNCIVRPPSSTYLANTWGTITVTGSVTST